MSVVLVSTGGRVRLSLKARVRYLVVAPDQRMVESVFRISAIQVGGALRPVPRDFLDALAPEFAPQL